MTTQVQPMSAHEPIRYQVVGRRIGLVYVGLCALLIGVRAAMVEVTNELDLLLAFAMSLGMTVTCVLDSRIIGKPMLPITQKIMLFTQPISALVYLVWSRKARGLIHVAIATIAFTAIIVCGVVIGAVVMAMIEDVRVNGW